MALPSMRPQSPFIKYVATEAAVPGKDFASAALTAEFNALLLGTFVVVEEDKALYYKGSSATYASGNRIVLLSSGSSGSDGVDGIFSNVAVLVVGDVVSKDINPNNVVKADASDGTLPAFGVVVDVITSTSCVVREFGECATITGGGAFTPGATVYLSETAGTATTTAPNTAGAVVQKIGIAKSASEVILGITPAFGGGFYARDGVQAQPSISFANDPGTGFLRSAASTMQIALGGSISAQFTRSGFTFVQQPVATGLATAFFVSAQNLSLVTAGTENPDVSFDLSHSVTWATGAITAQKAFQITAPTYDFIGASTITDAATFYVSAAPIAGMNATFTKSWAVWVDSGNVRLDGDIVMSGSTPSITATGANEGIELNAAGNGSLRLTLAGAGSIILDAGGTGAVQIGNNTASVLGFYGHATTAQQVLATGGGATVDQVITALQALGLVKQM